MLRNQTIVDIYDRDEERTVSDIVNEKKGGGIMAAYKHIREHMCKFALLIMVFLFLVLLASYNGDKVQVAELNSLLDEAKSDIEDMSAQVIDLENTIIAKDESIDELQALLEQINGIQFYEKDRIKYHGYGRASQSAEKPVELRMLPTEASASLGRINGRVIIISEVQTSNNEHWLLVKTSGRSTYGYVRSLEIELLEEDLYYISESEIAISGLRLGDSITKAIGLMGRDYIQCYYDHRPDSSEGILYHGTDILYKPVTLQIEEIRVRNKELKIEGLFGAGDSIDKAKEYFEGKYDTVIEENANGSKTFIIWDSEGYKLEITYDDNIIKGFSYSIYDFRA